MKKKKRKENPLHSSYVHIICSIELIRGYNRFILYFVEGRNVEIKYVQIFELWLENSQRDEIVTKRFKIQKMNRLYLVRNVISW